MRQEGRGDAAAVVGHRQHGGTVGLGQSHFDLPARARELHGVAEQGSDDLLEANDVTPDIESSSGRLLAFACCLADCRLGSIDDLVELSRTKAGKLKLDTVPVEFRLRRY